MGRPGPPGPPPGYADGSKRECSQLFMSRVLLANFPTLEAHAAKPCKVPAGNKAHLTHFVMSAKTYSPVLNETLHGCSLGL